MVGCMSVYLCVHTWAYIISVHIFSWWTINNHGCSLQSGLGRDSLDDCQISGNSHKDPKTQVCIISFERIQTWGVEWMNGWMNKSLLTCSKCFSNVGCVYKLPEASADPSPLSPQPWSSLQFRAWSLKYQSNIALGKPLHSCIKLPFLPSVGNAVYQHHWGVRKNIFKSNSKTKHEECFRYYW